MPSEIRAQLQQVSKTDALTEELSIVKMEFPALKVRDPLLERALQCLFALTCLLLGLLVVVPSTVVDLFVIDPIVPT